MIGFEDFFQEKALELGVVDQTITCIELYGY